MDSVKTHLPEMKQVRCKIVDYTDLPDGHMEVRVLGYDGKFYKLRKPFVCHVYSKEYIVYVPDLPKDHPSITSNSFWYEVAPPIYRAINPLDNETMLVELNYEQRHALLYLLSMFKMANHLEETYLITERIIDNTQTSKEKISYVLTDLLRDIFAQFNSLIRED